MALYSSLIKSEPVCIRRAQVNRMEVGGFAGRHLDVASNPNYEYSIALQFGESFQGGEFVVYPPNGQAPVVLKPTLYSMTISNCRFPHEVREVTFGVRVSLVYFVSHSHGANPNPPPPSILKN